MHIEWWSREEDNPSGPEFDEIVFPEEAEWVKVWMWKEPVWLALLLVQYACASMVQLLRLCMSSKPSGTHNSDCMPPITPMHVSLSHAPAAA